MKRLECKLILSMTIHFLWIVFILYCMIQVEGGTTNSIYRFFTINEHCFSSRIICLSLVYILEYIVYRIKPLKSKGDKRIFWVVTILMTALVAIPAF